MKHWKGFQPLGGPICAIDGTTALLPDRPAIKEEFAVVGHAQRGPVVLITQDWLHP